MLDRTLRGSGGACQEALVLGAALALELVLGVTPLAASARARAAIADGSAARVLGALRG